MPDSKMKRNLRIVILVIVGVVAFVVSIVMNVNGMRSAIEGAPDTSGMAGISVRTSGNGSLAAQTRQTRVDSEGKVVQEDFSTDALPIVYLRNYNWDRIKARFSGFQLDEEGNAVFEEGYTLYCNGTYVNYIVFNEDYKDNVVAHLKVGASFQEIESKLGEPTFRFNGCYGYKSRAIYAFFYENEIAVYPNRDISNKGIEELFKNYIEGLDGIDRIHLLVNIRQDYPDFVITEDKEENIVNIMSTTRQMIARLDALGNLEVELYNGYKIALEDTQEYLDEHKYITNEEDLVELMESERVRGN